MICDYFENAGLYFDESDLLYKAVSYAAGFEGGQVDGEYDVEGEDVKAIVASYETSGADGREFEVHYEHVDVQVLLEGEERIDVYSGGGKEVVRRGEGGGDAAFIKEPGSFNSLAMSPGMFAVFFTHDAHRPGCDLDGAVKVRKVCMKVKSALAEQGR